MVSFFFSWKMCKHRLTEVKRGLKERERERGGDCTGQRRRKLGVRGGNQEIGEEKGHRKCWDFLWMWGVCEFHDALAGRESERKGSRLGQDSVLSAPLGGKKSFCLVVFSHRCCETKDLWTTFFQSSSVLISLDENIFFFGCSLTFSQPRVRIGCRHRSRRRQSSFWSCNRPSRLVLDLTWWAQSTQSEFF